MSVDFLPSICTDQVKNRCTAYLPYELKNKVWDIIFKIQDHVVLIISGKPTEITLTANPGYSYCDCVFIMVTAILGAKTSLDTLMSIKSAKELTNMAHKVARLTEYGIPVINYRSIKPYFTKLIDWKTSEILNEAIKIKDIDVNTYLDKQLEMMAAKNRLEFVPWHIISFFPWEKANRLKKCDEAISYFETKIRIAQKINVETLRLLRQRSQAAAHDFHQEVTELSPVDTLKLLNIRKAEIERNNQIAHDVLKEFYMDEKTNKLYDHVLGITPQK